MTMMVVAQTPAVIQREVTVDVNTSNRPGTTYESDKKRFTLAAGWHACQSLPRHPPERPGDMFEGPAGLVRPQTVSQHRNDVGARLRIGNEVAVAEEVCCPADS